MKRVTKIQRISIIFFLQIFNVINRKTDCATLPDSIIEFWWWGDSKGKKTHHFCSKSIFNTLSKGCRNQSQILYPSTFSLRLCLVFLVVLLFHNFGKTTNRNIRSLWMGMCAIHSCCCATADAFYEVNLMCSSSKQSAVRRKKMQRTFKIVLCLFRNAFYKRQHNEFMSTFVNIHNEIFPVL